jgi:WG containing repeat
MKTLLLAFAVAIVPVVVAAGDGPLADCYYVAKRTPRAHNPEFTSHGSCGTYDPKHVPLFDPAMLASVHRDRRGLATVLVLDDGWYYIASNGVTAKVLTWDNGPDDFADGLTRFERNGRIGYLNQSLQVTIEPVYDFAWPFDGGKALVCVGCHRGHTDADGHTPVIDGLWGYINKQGKQVAPITHTRDELLHSDAQKK